MIEKKQRKRAKAMLPEIKLLITNSALNEPEKKRESLADELIEAIKEKFPKEKPPAWETVIKRISEARNKARPLDNPWHLGLLPEYPHISAEAVRHIDEVQQAMRSFFENVPVNPDSYHITIRHALWVARVYEIVRKHVETDEPRERFKNLDPHDPRILLAVAGHYADYEQLCDLANISFDTSELDAALSHGLQQFYDFVSKQEVPPLREGDIIPGHEVYEKHKNPHKMNGDWTFVFDPDCQACRDRELSGKWYELHMEVWGRQKAKHDRKEKNKKGGAK